MVSQVSSSYLVEDCVYHKFNGSKFIFLILYVDDFLLASSDIGLLHETKKLLSNDLEMKDLRNASFVRSLSRYSLDITKNLYRKSVE